MAALRLALPLALALALAACHKEKKPAPPPPTVMVATPLKQRVIDWNDYVGRFVSIDAVELRPRVSGYLTRIYFRDGQLVHKGEPLFLVDPRP